ncbi:MAG: EpsG family protein [Alistipes sp.]|nr:EpsG family protein [Alistipes sp.]
MYDSIDFAQGSTFAQCLYCFLLYCFLLLVSLKGNLTNTYTQDNYVFRKIILFGGILLFSLTSFVDADFFHYYESMYEYKNQVFVDTERGLEAFYQHLIYIINGNYFLFRLIVWGSSLLLIIFATRKFGANVYRTLFVILAGYIMTFSYARASLAMAVFTTGAVIVSVVSECETRKRIILTTLGLAIIACSIYFHRSMLPILVASICWAFVPWKKQLTKYSLWLFPFFVFLCSVVLENVFEELYVLANAIEDETGTLDKAELYAEQESVTHNIRGYFRLFLHYSTFYIPFVLIANVFRSEEVVQSVNKRIIWLYQIVYLIILIATSILFLDFGSRVFFYRFLYVSFIPMSILITKMTDSGFLKKQQYRWIVAVFIISNLFQLFAAVYSLR